MADLVKDSVVSSAHASMIERTYQKLMDAIVAVTTGEKLDVGKNSIGTVAVTGITTATVQIEGSLDGAIWFQIGANITADTLVSIAPYIRYVRGKVSAWTSGTITVIYFGRE